MKNIEDFNDSTQSKKILGLSVLLIISAYFFYLYFYRPYKIDRNIKEAEKYFSEEQYITSLDLFKDAYYMLPNNEKYYSYYELFFSIGQCYLFNEGVAGDKLVSDYDSALVYFNKAIDANDNRNHEYYFNRAEVLSKLNKFSSAIYDYNAAIDISPQSEYFYSRSVAYLNSGNYRALDDINKVIELTKNRSSYTSYSRDFLHKGMCYYSQGWYVDAIVSYEKAIKYDKNNYLVYFHKGNAQYSLGEESYAITSYTKAIELNASHEKSYRNRGIAKYESCTEGSCADLSKACELGDSNACTEVARIRKNRECN